MIGMDEPVLTVPKSVLDAPGGFAWWYAEVMSDTGDGCVLIWSFGLPFLPDWESKVRQGHGERPRRRPSLNVAVYRGGSPIGYVLHEFCPEDVAWNGAGEWRFGDSELALRETEHGRELKVSLDCPVVSSGGRFKGTLTALGRAPFWAGERPVSDCAHRWVPMMTSGRGRVSLLLDDGSELVAEGHAYHDRNWSTKSLGQLDISEWRWGHLASSGTERVMYRLTSTGDVETLCFGVEMGQDGALRYAEGLNSVDEGVAKTTWGIRCPQQWRGENEVGAFMDLTFEHLVDDGPFYVRGVTSGAVDGEPALGSAEIIRVGHIDLARHRALVRMRVASDQRRNSMWLSLFEGSHKNPLGRLVRSWTGSKRRRANV